MHKHFIDLKYFKLFNKYSKTFNKYSKIFYKYSKIYNKYSIKFCLKKALLGSKFPKFSYGICGIILF